MIIKGSEHDNAGNLARYLLAPKDGEREFVMELRDTATDDLVKSLTDWEAIGRCKSKGHKILYHAHIRLCDGESLRESQWFKVVEDLEQRLGFMNCPRAIVGHNNARKGLHLHIVWSRVDPTKKPLVKLGNDHKHLHVVAREAEKEFGLTTVKDKTPDRPKRRLSDREIRALKDRGINREQITKFVRASWNATDTGHEMRDMLKALGVDLIPGERRDWIIQYKGLKINPVRLLEGVGTAEFRVRMSDVDIDKQRETSADATATLHRKRAAYALSDVLKQDFANDPQKQAAKKPSKKWTRQAPQPRLKPKIWYRDPGI